VFGSWSKTLPIGGRFRGLAGMRPAMRETRS
jgi:hypothetical protein